MGWLSDPNVSTKMHPPSHTILTSKVLDVPEVREVACRGTNNKYFISSNYNRHQ